MPTTAAKVVYKKTPGVLELTDAFLQWTQNGQRAPSVRVPLTEAASLFCSKEGAPQVKLKIALVGDDNGHNFTFVSPSPLALTEREKFKAELTTIIGRNRKVSEAPTKPSINLAFSTVSTAQTPKPQASRATSVSSDTMRATPIIPGTDPAADFRHRKSVFVNNPDLAALHRELVIGGHVSEAEFWEGREHLIYAQVAQDSQRKGKSGVIVDPRTETVDGVIQLTPQLIHDTFEQYPVVAKAYSETVPTKVFGVIPRHNVIT
jgi:transcription initiation factor TFIIH subunit 1